MKPTSNNASLSPPTRASPSGITKASAQLPISRSNNSTWEKPERARTSHACEPCRERKTKCDGERPSCRRCLHTGTSCHYGYGKGWRKRKTAEDLTATSRRLERYESLLSQILPMVSVEVRNLIEEARDQDTVASNGSETAETEHTYPPTIPLTKTESSSSSTGNRILLPLPIPSPHAPGNQRPSSSSTPFDSVTASITTSVPSLTPSTGGQSQLSPDTAPLTRLPSITPDGLLIEGSATDRSPSHQQRGHDAKVAPGPDRFAALPTSPSSQTSHGDRSKNTFSPT